MITLYSLFGKKIGFLLFILIWGVNFSTNQSSEAAALNFSKSPKKPAGRLWRPFIQTPPSISIVCIIECSLIKTGFLARLAQIMYKMPSAKQHFNNKLKGHGGQRISQTDVTKALDILNQMAEDIRQIEVKDAEN